MILALFPFPPNRNGYGGSQRAWYLADALSRIGPTHFVFLHPTRDSRFDDFDTRVIEAKGASVTMIATPEWDRSSHFLRPRRFSAYADYVRMKTPDAPTLSRKALRRIADRLPIKDVDTIFAFRISMATIADGLLRAGLVRSKAKLVDFDDIMSRFREGETKTLGRTGLTNNKLANMLLQRALKRAEERIALTWDAVSLCSDDDVEILKGLAGCQSKVVKVPNVVDRPPLPSTPSEQFRLLFVGNLTFGPNVQGLRAFLEEAWPIIKDRLPHAKLSVVGMRPTDDLADEVVAAGGEIHANVPSVVPHYAEADLVIAPIFFGSGTRIKIIEAMAFERAVLSTTLGAEGLGVEPGYHALIADTMPEFAEAAVKLALDDELRISVAKAGRELQQSAYSSVAMERGLSSMFD